jgi:acyl-CoA synthetase (AMP-forming)/AMP-acid ligase II
MQAVGSGSTIGGLLSRSARRLPRKTALVFEGERLSYRELNERSNRLAHALIGLGARCGMKIGLLSRNCTGFVVSHFGVAKSGATLVPLNFMLAPRELEYVIRHSDAEVLIFSEEFEATVDALRPGLAAVKRYVAMGCSPPWAHHWEDLLTSGPTEEPGVDVREDDAYTLMYTSGTTGRPKGVVSSHRARVEVSLQGVIDYQMREEQVTVLALPMFHMGGLNTCFTSHVLSGATVVLMRKFDVEELLRNAEKEHATFLFLAPSPMYSIIDSPLLAKYDHSSVRFWMYGGAPMPQEIFRKAAERLPRVRFIQGYGSTEAGQLTVVRPEEHPARAHTAGSPCCLADVRVVDREGREVALGEVGEIVARGPQIMTEYYKQPEETAESLRGGWFHTGDLARVEAGNFLTIVDRSTEMIVSGSENIYPKEVEEVLYMHPAVQDAAVFGIPDEKWGESVCAAIVVKAGERVTAAQLIEFCRANLAGYKKPRVVEFVDALPRTSIGKIAKSELREPYWRGRERKI